MNLQPPAARLVTLTDVAREAGVGESTVSRVLRKQGSYSKRTETRVSEAVARLGYVPNRLAGTLAGSMTSGGSKLIGVIIPSLANSVFPDLLSGINTVLDASGLQGVIGVNDYDLAGEEKIVDALLSWRPSGLILTGLEHTSGTLSRLNASGIRIVEMFDIDGPGVDIVVGFSNRDAGRISARHLITRGYRRFGYIGHDMLRDVRAQKRFDGFAATLQAAGISLSDQEIVAAPSSAGAGRDALQRLLQRSPELDAIYFSNDDMATGGYFHCLAADISIPDRLALFGFNGLEMTSVLPRPLSTLRTPRARIGEIAAMRLQAGGPSETIDLGVELVEGATA